MSMQFKCICGRTENFGSCQKWGCKHKSPVSIQAIHAHFPPPYHVQTTTFELKYDPLDNLLKKAQSMPLTEDETVELAGLIKRRRESTWNNS